MQKELSERFKESAFAVSTFNQLQRDFNRIGLQLEYSEEVLKDASTFSAFLGAEIEALIKQNPALLSQLFYLIDLPENQVNKLLNKTRSPEHAIGEAILRRAAQKVIFREKYKSGNL